MAYDWNWGHKIQPEGRDSVIICRNFSFLRIWMIQAADAIPWMTDTPAANTLLSLDATTSRKMGTLEVTADTIVGHKSGGSLGALSPADIRTILGATTAYWNALSIRGYAVQDHAPLAGEALIYSGSQYEPGDHGALGGKGDDDHSQYHDDTRGDVRYYRKDEHLNSSGGAGDAGKPIVLDADGDVDATMVNSADVDHDATTNFEGDEHIDHTGVSVTAGTGLSGGGTIAATRTVNLDADANDLNDVDIAGIERNQVLKWNGSEVVPGTAGDTEEFTFDIATFGDGQTTPQLIGTGVWIASGSISFTATYDNGPPDSAYIALSSNGGVTWVENLTLDSPYTSGSSAQDTDYPSAKDKYITFTLNASGGGENPTDTETVYFRNHIRWGVANKNNGFTEADVEGLASNVLSNDQTRSVSLAPGVGEYLVFAFPATYTSLPDGDDYEDDGTSGFLFNSIACAFQAPETVSITNAAGYTEDYKVYASEEANLGNHTLVTSTSGTQINPLYYGKTVKTDTFTEADVEGLANSEITNDNTQTWDSVTTGAGEYMLFAFPKRLGTVAFWVGGFEGGFESPETVSVTNTNGWSEDYYVWRSTQADLGATVVETK